MAPNLSLFARIRAIQAIRRDKLNFIQASRKLNSEGIKCSRYAAAYIYKKYLFNGMIKSLPRRPKVVKVTNEHKEAINSWIDADREITCRVLCKNLQSRFQVTISTSQMCRIVNKLGWEKGRTRYCQIVSQQNKVKRVGYAFLCLINMERFDNCIFIDESSIEIELHTLYRWFKTGEKKEKCGIPKKALKVHVLAGISKRGPTPICVFEGNMDSVGYQTILQRNMVQWIHETFPDGHRLIMDNDPKHRSATSHDFYAQHGICHWETPEQSPDLNPIELVWACLKHFIREVKPLTKEELVGAIGLFWTTKVTPDYCTKFINHIQKVLPEVLKRFGASTEY